MPDKDFEINKDHGDLVDSYRQCFSTNEGEKVLKDLKAAYGDRSSYSNDSHDTAYKEGQRSVYLRIFNLIKERKE